MEIFYYQLLRHVPPADGSLMVRLTIPVALVVGWALFGRRPRPMTLVGGAVICAGMRPCSSCRWPPQHRVLVAAVGCAFAFNLRTFSAEFHPWNRRPGR